VKPLIGLRDGETHPIERVRTRTKAIERLCELVKGFSSIKEMAILHSTTPEEAERLVERIAPIFPRERIYMARIGPIIGTHLGPGALTIALIEGER